MARRQSWSVGELIIEEGGQIRIDKGNASVAQKVVRAFHVVPAVYDLDRLVVSTNMKNGAYTLAQTASVDGLARNVSVTQTITNAAEDTNGTITIVGKDNAGNRIEEVITPNGGATVAGTKAFKTITSVTGAGWVINGADPDTITVGFGSATVANDLIGLPECLAGSGDVVLAMWNGTPINAPVIATSATVLASNTFQPPDVTDGTKAMSIIYMV